MELSFSPSAASTRLKRLSRQLRAGDHPYYLHTPRGDAEPAPGWYWKPENAQHPQYLGHNSFDAEYKLRRKIDDMRAQPVTIDEPEEVAA